MSIFTKKRRARERRATRVRSAVRGTPERPRLSVFRSNRGIWAQIIDDRSGCTLVSAGSKHVEEAAGLKKADVATKVGELLAERARAAGVERVVFDRGPYLYHGRVKALAEGARQGGLDF
ncbi:MAG: 50S ribosomal protein L18 [Thermoleophilia bacterium]|nr:50S ribosomal protein L18 [Thermoleophilia bacterium]